MFGRWGPGDGILLFAAAILSLLVASACGSPAAENRAPDFSLPHLFEEGRNVTLSEYRGQPVVLNFFASWCLPCRKEMPALEDAHQTYQDAGLVVIGVGTKDGRRPVMGFALSMGVTFPVVWDGLGEMFTAYRIPGMPTTCFVNRDGSIESTVIGGVTPEQLEQGIRAIMN